MEENNPSFRDHTRKSVVGAVYRVGASFTIDAIYLTLAGATAAYLEKRYGFGSALMDSASSFAHTFDPGKFARITAAVVAINFVDYKFRVTEKLDIGAKGLLSRMKR